MHQPIYKKVLKEVLQKRKVSVVIESFIESINILKKVPVEMIHIV